MSLPFCVRNLLVCVSVFVLGAGSVSADPALVPQGAEYGITSPKPGDQMYPQAAISSSGGFLVWQDNSVTPLGTRVVAQRLDGNQLGIDEPFAVSSAAQSKLVGDQEKPQVALLPDGGAVVVWQQVQGRKKRIQQNVYARFINADGSFRTSDILVSRRPAKLKETQTSPAVAALSNGTAVVVWENSDRDGSQSGVFARLFSFSGAAIGDEFQVNQFTSNNQRSPAIAALHNGNFVVVWVSELQRNPASSIDIFGRIYSDSGVPVGNEFAVSVTTTNACGNPAVAASSDGFAVLWSQRDDVSLVAASTVTSPRATLSSASWDVFGRIFGHNGTPVTGAFRVNSTTYGDQYGPRVASSGQSYFAVWHSMGQDGSFEGVYGRMIQGGGDLTGGEIRVNTTTISRQIHPSVTSNDGGRFVCVWSSFRAVTSFDVLVQQYLHSEQ